MYSYDFTPIGETEPAIHKDVTYELEQYPVDETEKDLEKHCTPAIRGHMKDYVERHATGGRYRARSYLHRELHAGQSEDEARAHARLGRKGGRVTGDDEANRLLLRPYRNPCVHPAPANV